eukprot:6475913-Amphidinium_carterae.1
MHGHSTHASRGRSSVEARDRTGNDRDCGSHGQGQGGSPRLGRGAACELQTDVLLRDGDFLASQGDHAPRHRAGPGEAGHRTLGAHGGVGTGSDGHRRLGNDLSKGVEKLERVEARVWSGACELPLAQSLKARFRDQATKAGSAEELVQAAFQTYVGSKHSKKYGTG